MSDVICSRSWTTGSGILVRLVTTTQRSPTPETQPEPFSGTNFYPIFTTNKALII